MEEHSPQECPQCGEFGDCQRHFHDEFGLFWYEFFCEHCNMIFPVMAGLETVAKE